MSKKDYLLTQVGNPEGEDKPNKKVRSVLLKSTYSKVTCIIQYYDPRVWVREGEKTLTTRVKEACTDLGNVSKLPSPHVSSICVHLTLGFLDQL